MKNIKDIIISIFAVIGFLVMITGFTNEYENAVQQSSSILATPESHVWEVIIGEANSSNEGRAYMWNKVTGEVRKISRTFPTAKTLGLPNRELAKSYIVMEGIKIE